MLIYSTTRKNMFETKRSIAFDMKIRKWSYHINDLHQRDTKADLYGIRFVGNGSFQDVVLVEEMMKQFFLVGPLHRDWQWQNPER